ncbi:MAG: hypothetical protein U0793_32955 [Gemmataceae bacterium]|mgnify:CR=1 FL=1
MARCDEGYRCAVCGAYVEEVVDSDLYLRYVLGEVEPLKLPSQPERHIVCDPVMAQFIVDPAFPPVTCPGAFDKANLDPEFVREEEDRITRGWRRLQDVVRRGVPIPEYPLPEARQKWRKA